MRGLVPVFLGLLLALGPGRAQEAPSPGAADACASFDWPLARESAWFARPDLPVLPSGSELAPDTQAAVLVLKPFSEAGLPQAPTREPKPGSFAGYLRVPARAEGLLQVSLSGEGWIDVGEDGAEPLRPLAHTGRRDCAGLRKSLRFQAGSKPLVIAVSNAAADSIRIAVASAE